MNKQETENKGRFGGFSVSDCPGTDGEVPVMDRKSGIRYGERKESEMKRISALLLALLLLLTCVSALADPAADGGYTVKTGVSYDETWGLTVANVIFRDGKIFKILIDTVRPDGGLSSKEQFDNYGAKKPSSIGKEWWEQVVSFEDWATANDVAALALDESGHDVDGVTGATIAVSYYVDAVKDALSK